MTLTFDTKSYSDLLVQYQPKPIANDEENEAAIALAEELDRRPTRTTEEDLFLKLLVTLIEAYESEHYPIPDVAPDRSLRHLLEYSGTKQSDLVEIWQSTSDIVAEIVVGKRPMTPVQAEALAKRFHVSPGLFL